MNWFKLLALLRKLPFGDLLDYPKDITDSAACRKWVLAVLDSLEIVAELTDMDVDDEIVETIQGVINNAAAWDFIHSTFVRIVNYNASRYFASFKDSEDVVRLLDSELSDALDVRSEVRGFNPMIIMVIIQAVVLLLKLFRSRK